MFTFDPEVYQVNTLSQSMKYLKQNVKSGQVN